MTDAPSRSSSQLIERKLATILSADVAEFSRLMGEDEEQTLRVFRGHKKIFESLVATHRGRIFNTAGDAILAEFSSTVEAVRCATDVQPALRTRNDQLPPNRQVRFRIGMNLGDVMIQGEDLLGDGVNVAARLQTAAEPGGICISGSVYDQIRNKLALSFYSLGERSYKNIQQPVRTFSIVEAEGGNVLPAPKERGSRKATAVWLAVGLLIVLVAGFGAYALHQRGKIQNAPAGAVIANVAPQPAPPSQAIVAQPANASTVKPAPPAPQPRAKVIAPAKVKPDATEKHSGRYDGLYSGPVCYAKTRVLPARCYDAEGVIRGDKITGSWPMPNESGITMTLDGRITPSGDVTIFMHSDRADGTRVTTINLTGTVRDGSIDAAGTFLRGRPANLTWHLGRDTSH